MTRRARQALPPALLFAAIVGIWFFVSYVLLEPRRRFLLPPPQDVIRIGFLDGDNLSEILDGLVQSIAVAVVGLSIATVLGLALAIAMSQARWIERSLYPWAVVLQTVPILAIVPLIGFWFKFGFSSRVLVCVLISLFPIVTNTLFGLKSAAREHHELFTLNEATRWQRLWRLQLPWALPAIFAGLRISAGLSVIGAIVGDFFFQQGPPGLGRLLSDYTYQLQSEQLLATVFFSCLLGLVVFWLFGLAARLATGAWHDSYAP
ncbi:ABC transporter permease [Solirubrobacter soli]|uniref:ABC transporter permease n=1 Tax=Solirubrobacter soli TaxID=363832 RepID=UPI00040634A4|nr:ABC transporter permease [Solirubrobacter soli]